MSTEFFFRLVGMVIFAVVGALLGDKVGRATDQSPQITAILFGLLGMLIGLILTPYFTTRPVRAIRRVLLTVTAQTLASGLTGMIVGLIIAALLTFPLSLLPDPFGKILPFVGVLVFSYFGIAVFVMRQGDIFTTMRQVASRSSEEPAVQPAQPMSRPILLDTSVIIDGRIADLARTGFIMGTLIIHRFVLVMLLPG